MSCGLVCDYYDMSKIITSIEKQSVSAKLTPRTDVLLT
jgi:hypothetical protein